MSRSFPVRRSRFSSLPTGILRRGPVYLDNACLTPTPRKVSKAVADFYSRPPACLLRSPSRQSKKLDLAVRGARESIRRYIGAQFSDEIVFTFNTTMAINLIAGAFGRREGAVLISEAEHNSNRLPWLFGDIVEVRWPPGGDFSLDEYSSFLGSGVKLVSLASVSHVTGARLPVREVIRIAHEKGVLVHIDAAQQVIHHDIDIEEDQPDFLSFSLHKAYGPSGLGVLYIRRQLQSELNPLFAGGGTVDDHSDRTSTPTEGVARFEYGLQNYAAISSVSSCIDFLERYDVDVIASHFRKLNAIAREGLGRIDGLTFVGPSDASDSSHICNFVIEGVDSTRLAELLDSVADIQVRSGLMCAHHYYHRHGMMPSVRVSFGYHNTEKEVYRLVRYVESIVRHYL